VKKLKRWLKPIFVTLVALLILTGIPHVANAATSVFTYNEMSNGIEVTGYTGNDSNITIPQVIDQKTVIGISNDAFVSSATLTSVIIPESVTYIGNNAFRDCTYLTSVRFLGNAPTLGEQALNNVAGDFKIYYNPAKSGFTNSWNGFTVLPYISVTGITIDKTSATLMVGDSLSVTTSIVPSDATNKNIKWTSSNPKVATVDESGFIQAIGLGNANITATSEGEGLTATCTINVAGLPTVPIGEYAIPANYDAVKVIWGQVLNATGYKVYKASKIDGSYTEVADVPTTEFNDSHLKTGTAYYYKVKAYITFENRTEISDFTPIITVKTLDKSIGSTLFLYMSNLNNRNSVFAKAVKLHNGNPKNTCALTVSESFRRLGMNIPTYIARTEQVEGHLKARGWVREMDLKLLQPGDVCFTTDTKGNLTGGHSTHTFIFMSWANKEKTLMNICDNQASSYKGNVYHTRTIFKSSKTDATAFFYHTKLTNVSTILKLPTAIKVKATAYNTVQLSWGTAISANGFKIYRATSKYGTYTNIASTANSSYIDTTALTGKTYYYKVRAFGSYLITTVYGNYTNVGSAKTSLTAPSVIASSTSKKTVKLSWTGVSGANGYEVYRAKSKNGSYTRIATTPKLTYTNSSMVSKKTYYYKVRAYRNVGKTKVYSGYFYVKVKIK